MLAYSVIFGKLWTLKSNKTTLKTLYLKILISCANTFFHWKVVSNFTFWWFWCIEEFTALEHITKEHGSFSNSGEKLRNIQHLPNFFKDNDHNRYLFFDQNKLAKLSWLKLQNIDIIFLTSWFSFYKMKFVAYLFYRLNLIYMYI